MKRRLYYYLMILFLTLSFTSQGCSKSKSPEISKEEPETPAVTGFKSSYDFDLSQPVLTRNFYALAKIMDYTPASDVFASQTLLNNTRTEMLMAFNNELENPNTSIAAIGLSLKFTDAQITAIIDDVSNAADNSFVKEVINNHLKPSGAYQIYVDYSDNNYLKYAIRECLKGINQIIDVYTQNVVPLDAISDLGLYHQSKDTYKSTYLNVLKNASKELQLSDTRLFFEPSLEFALMLLKINTREEAGAFEPLEKGENMKAIHYLKNVNWDDYPYASMLLLGDSPNSPGDDVNLSTSAKNRVANAVDNLKAGLAPVVIISGSNVYPNLTPYFEAVEMKKYMMSKYGIDGKQIIVDPHGRHTTSNVRNASRIIFKYDIPSTKKSIITGTASHINTIVDPAFAKRCNNYFGYMPGVLGERVSTTTLEFTPEVKSLSMQPSLDPLDP